ncbi:putative flavin-binding monooxygenase [Leucosporidium creatinivorum]|uniref:L-ornithine N(5)-monooxygenase [NAD(P)H] n=1 Tax=Leucosporidium creatinivorum TaxID=106004 RepID=A0A1Y2FRW6_9BASI|nr:putative flavin-binding monooxygenase [Leucosporidium creatinivorum]
MESSKSYSDPKDHYGCIIIGAGMSGIAMAVQLKRKLAFTDIILYEKNDDVGGTWGRTSYPGCACDVPVGLYSFSFEPKGNFDSQWGSAEAIWSYIKDVQTKYEINQVVYRTAVESAHFSRETGLWTVNVRLDSGETRTRTCNILISAAGILSTPNPPPFDTSTFAGDVVHSGAWNPEVKLEGKDVVVVGNGCSAAQLIPTIADEVGSLTQIARGRQSFLPAVPIPEGALYSFMVQWIPGFVYFMRLVLFLMLELDFQLMDVQKGKKRRESMYNLALNHMKSDAPREYWDFLLPEFEVGAKRRVIDRIGYLKSLGHSKLKLIAEQSLVSAHENIVTTDKGVEIKADVVILCTGYKAQDFLFPLKIVNEKREGVRERTCVSGFPNFFMLLGPNTATGHSSALVTSECQISMVLELISPIIAKIRQLKLESVPPTVEVTAEAEQTFFDALRAEMKRKIWEQEPVGWYVDSKTGICTTNYPWSQIHFWRKAAWINRGDFKWIGC